MKKNLIVIINGAGTTGNELRSLYKRLKKDEEDYFVYYPGIMPGGFINDYFPKSNVKRFKVFIDETLELIDDPYFDKVYLIGYSLGASTAAVMAQKSNNIDKLILISPIVKNPNFRKFIKGLTSSLTHSKKLTRIERIFYGEFIRRIRIIPKINIFHLQVYFFFIKKYLKGIDKPTLIIETTRDELVKEKSIDFIEKHMENDEFERYKVESSHFLFFDRNVRDDVIEKIEDFIKEDDK
ncbi:MAG: alpha/beta hydrolase [Candidatus Izimaplasma sp.]|nr:alpha/beta hydrolase [Candidatus Izimaplasma bacterium]